MRPPRGRGPTAPARRDVRLGGGSRSMVERCFRGSGRRLAGAGAVCALASAAVAGEPIEPLATMRVASGLNLPVYVTHAPGDFERLFIVEKPGRIKILNLVTGNLNPQTFLDIGLVVGGSNEALSD